MIQLGFVKYKDIPHDKIFVIWRTYCPHQSGEASDPSIWKCKVVEYVKIPEKKCFMAVRKSGVYDKYVRSDYEADNWFGIYCFYDKPYTKTELLLACQVKGLTPLYSFNESARDYATDYYLCLEQELKSREFRKMRLEVE